MLGPQCTNQQLHYHATFEMEEEGEERGGTGGAGGGGGLGTQEPHFNYNIMVHQKRKLS